MRASATVMPRYFSGAGAMILPATSMTESTSSPQRWPASKSLKSCPGVTLTAPEPNAGSTNSSATIGISRSASGSRTILPMSAA